MGIGDWAQSPNPNTQNPNPKTQINNLIFNIIFVN